MFPTEKSAMHGPVRRLVLLTVGLVPVALAILLAIFWIDDHVQPWVYWKAALVFLITFKLVYWHVVVLAPVGLAVVAFLLFSGRRPRSRQFLFRGFVLCGSLLFGVIVAETTCAIWQFQSHRRTALPIGGDRNATVSAPSSPAARVPRDIALPTKFTHAKDDGEINFVILGESSAEGVPYNYWVSIGGMVRWQLNEVIPGRPVHIETLAVSRETLERQHEKLGGLTHDPMWSSSIAATTSFRRGSLPQTTSTIISIPGCRPSGRFWSTVLTRFLP